MSFGDTTLIDDPALPPEERRRRLCLRRRIYLSAVPITLVANTVIAGFLYLVAGYDLRSDLLYSHSIGFSVLFLHWLVEVALARRRAPHWVATAVALPGGALLGLSIVWAVQGRGGEESLRDLAVTAATTALFGGAVTWFFHARARLADHASRLQQEALAREEAARRLAEAELKLLQAQIEPHFLFNTLSNVLSLVDGDPPRAKRMLLNLTGYLRGTLRRTRQGATSLGEELDLVRAYLEIQAVRMGPRLRWRIDCPEALRDLDLPPLLLQPLVENALRHALEPRPEGGEVTVTVARERQALVLEVADDGPGLDPHRPPGVGLRNVRARIQAVSGGRGALSLRPIPTGGLCARIELPLAAAGAGRVA